MNVQETIQGIIHHLTRKSSEPVDGLEKVSLWDQVQFNFNITQLNDAQLYFVGVIIIAVLVGVWMVRNY